MADAPEDTNASLVRKRFDDGRKSTRRETRDYWMNHAFIHGRQWIWLNPNSGTVQTLRMDPDRVQVTANRLWPASRTIVSKVTQRDLTFEVMPTAADDATVRGAALAEAVLADVHYAHDWEALRENLTWATWKGGTAAICVDWDPNLGSPITIPSALGSEEPGEGEFPGDDPVFEGDTVETLLTIAEMVVEPGVRDAAKARWWVKVQALPPEQVQAQFNLPQKPPADATAGDNPFAQRNYTDGETTGNETPELTLVLTYYERPNALCKKGRVIVVVDNKTVDGPKEWPFPFKDRLNLALCYETPVESRWTGETVVTMARPMQVLYNLAQSSITEHIKNAGNARMAVPQSAIDLIDNLTDMPGEMFPYQDGMAPPSWLSPPAMPNWWLEQPDRLAMVLDDLLGVHDVSRGVTPSNIESGYGLSILSENDNTPVGKMVKSQAKCFSQVASMVLELYEDMVVAKRPAIVSAPGQPPESHNWSGADLEGQTRATIPVDTIIPRSRAAMQQTADKMMQMKLIGSFEEYAAIAELPGARSMVDRLKPDVAKARRENAQMALGEVCVPADFDDHAAHIAEHNVFRKSVKFERLPPAWRDMIAQHIQAHSTLAGEQAGSLHAGAAISPMAATIPRADGAPTLSAEQLPPDALSPTAVPANAEALNAEGAPTGALTDASLQGSPSGGTPPAGP